MHGAINSVSNDKDNTFQQVNATLFGNDATVAVLQPFGVESVPLDDSHIYVLTNGDQANKMGLVGSPEKRVNKVEVAGDICIYNPATGDYILIKSTGIEVVSKTSVTVTAPTVAIKGNLTVTGTITAVGQITSGGIGLTSHRHSGVQTGGGTSGSSVA
jgi:phage baseplate assembly protein V